MPSLDELIRELPAEALHPHVRKIILELQRKVDTMVLQLSALEAAVAAAVAKLDAGSSSQFTQATQDAAVAAQQSADAAAQASVDAANQSVVDGLTSSLNGAGPATPAA